MAATAKPGDVSTFRWTRLGGMDRATAGAIDTAQERAAHAARDAMEDAGGAGADEQAAGVGHGRSVRGAARNGDGGTA